jgi:hypothetical protein
MRRNTQWAVGTGISAVLAVLDVAGLAGLGVEGAPPPWLVLAGAVLGVVTLAAALPALRGSRRAGRVVIASRVLSAALGLPVFVVDGAPGWAVPIVVGTLVLTAIATWLMVQSSPRSEVLAPRGAR